MNAVAAKVPPRKMKNIKIFDFFFFYINITRRTKTTINLISGRSSAPTPTSAPLLTQPCIPQEVVSGNPDDPQPLESHVEDTEGDFILNHPFFEESFNVVYGSFGMIPSALAKTEDITRVTFVLIRFVFCRELIELILCITGYLKCSVCQV